MTPAGRAGPALTAEEEAMLAGGHGDAVALTMRVVVRLARVQGAARLLPVTGAHVDGCLYHGRAGLDFAERLAALGGRVRVPATLNVGSLDLLHPGLFRGDGDTRRQARRLMDAYTAMGCEPTWTCAPYQLPSRPAFGEHVAWAESNAICFANSVLGARTDRYGDFLDICAALTGRVPEAGLHLTENRRGRLLLDVTALPHRLLETEVCYPVLGYLVGRESGTAVPVIEGLPAGTDEDRLRALGAAAASSGGVALFHAVGLTPEARTVAEACGDRAPERIVRVTPAMVREARDSLTTARADALDAVSVGTPHLSVAEFGELVSLVRGARFAVPCYASTSRHVLAEAERRGWRQECERAGVTIVTDTCTYVTPILHPGTRVVMTNSAKWAHYAPANIGVDVVFGSLAECVCSAEAGRVVRDDGLWRVD